MNWKREICTRSPGYSLQTQQRKLNKFVKEYNELKAHEALGCETAEFSP
ncbi:hypothetical protein [Marispirochaeta sp.]|nr:hypothetical protein [Marispirochaeta sp.]